MTHTSPLLAMIRWDLMHLVEFARAGSNARTSKTTSDMEQKGVMKGTAARVCWCHAARVTRPHTCLNSFRHAPRSFHLVYYSLGSIGDILRQSLHHVAAR